MIHPVGSDRGITHFFTATKEIQLRESEKEKRTNEQYWLLSVLSARRAVLWYLAFLCICRLSPTCIFAKFLQSYKDCQLILTGLPSLLLYADRCPLWTANSSWPVLSTVRSRLSLTVILRQLPSLGSFSNSTSGFSRTSFSSPTSGLVGDLESKSFVWFRIKTDKEIVCLADHPHSVTILSSSFS